MKQKRLSLFLASAIITCFLFSCEEENDVRANAFGDDNETLSEIYQGQAIDSVDAASGIVSYDKELMKWSILEFMDGKTDHVSTFFPTSLDEVFRKEGLPVILSGSVLRLKDTFMADISKKEGYEYYAMDISAIVEDSVKANEIIGSWYLSERYGGLSMPVTYGPNEIICRFYNNGILIVQDMRKTDYVEYGPAGPHKYTLDEENRYLFIDNAKCYYSVNDNKLTIDTGSAWDGFVYILQKEDEK